MKVKCIDNDGSGHGYLTVGRVYEVEGESPDNRYRLVGVSNPFGGWNKRRFQEVAEDSAAPSEKTIRQVSQIQNDIEEEQCWKAMRPRVEPGHCICGCPKQLCDYHR